MQVVRFQIRREIEPNTRFNLTLRTSRKCRLSGCYTHSPMGWLFLREIMTTVYFAKRCKSDRKVIDERNRPLTDEGVSASYKVMEILKDKKK